MDLLKINLYRMNQAASIQTQFQLLEYVRKTEDGPIEAQMFIGSESELYKHIAEVAYLIQMGDIYAHELVKQTMVNYLELVESLFQKASILNYEEVDCYYLFDKMPGSQLAWNHPNSDYQYIEGAPAYYEFKNLEPAILVHYAESLKAVKCDLKIDLSFYFTEQVVNDSKPLKQLNLF